MHFIVWTWNCLIQVNSFFFLFLYRPSFHQASRLEHSLRGQSFFFVFFHLKCFLNRFRFENALWLDINLIDFDWLALHSQIAGCAENYEILLRLPLTFQLTISSFIFKNRFVCGHFSISSADFEVFAYIDQPCPAKIVRKNKNWPAGPQSAITSGIHVPANFADVPVHHGVSYIFATINPITQEWKSHSLCFCVSFTRLFVI